MAPYLTPSRPCLPADIFFAFPHVSIGESGEVGSLLRRGRGKPSNACGALIAIKNDINKGGAVSPDADDAEYVLLKKKVMSKVAKKEGDVSLVQVTKAAMQAINDDIEKLISLTVDPKTADYAVITGVQIHSGNQVSTRLNCHNARKEVVECYGEPTNFVTTDAYTEVCISPDLHF